MIFQSRIRRIKYGKKMQKNVVQDVFYPLLPEPEKPNFGYPTHHYTRASFFTIRKTLFRAAKNAMRFDASVQSSCWSAIMTRFDITIFKCSLHFPRYRFFLSLEYIPHSGIKMKKNAINNVCTSGLPHRLKSTFFELLHDHSVRKKIIEKSLILPFEANSIM